MKEELQKSLELAYLKGLTDEALVTVLNNTVSVDFTSKNPILAGKVESKLSNNQNDMTFMIHDLKTILKTFSSYKNPSVEFKGRNGELNVYNPFCVEFKEGRSKLMLILGIQSTFRKPRVVKTYESLFSMNMDKEFTASFRSQSNILDIETFYIQCNKKNKATFFISKSHKKLSDYLEIETKEEVVNNIPEDLRFDTKTFITILNHYPDSDIQLSLNEKFMTLTIKDASVHATYYLAKIKKI